MSTTKSLVRTLLHPAYTRFKYLTDRLDASDRKIALLEQQLEQKTAALQRRLDSLETHTIHRRAVAIDEILGYLELAEVPGDYLEFGVYTGHTFSHAFSALAAPFPQMRFIALDSFEGLPEPEGLDNDAGYTGGFQKTDYVCAKDDFLAGIQARGVDLSRVITVEGWFDKSLTPEMAAQHKIEKVAVAWIDCDYYESTVPVLNFITPYLTVGSVIAFDDWRCFRNQPDRGEQRACAEWLAANPHIKLRELFSFGWNGMAFTVNDQ